MCSGMNTLSLCVKFRYTYIGIVWCRLMKMKEVIVVEGRHDSVTLKQYFEVDTIETGGSAINEDTLKYIAEVKEKRGVIIFTDPDYPGERIRSIINNAIPGCKNAFLEKSKALGNHKVGIEHANKKDLEDALRNCVSFAENPSTTITMTELVELGLAGSGSIVKRQYVADYYHIGKCNAKTLVNRLNLLGISLEELYNVCKESGL